MIVHRVPCHTMRHCTLARLVSGGGTYRRNNDTQKHGLTPHIHARLEKTNSRRLRALSPPSRSSFKSRRVLPCLSWKDGSSLLTHSYQNRTLTDATTWSVKSFHQACFSTWMCCRRTRDERLQAVGLDNNHNLLHRLASTYP